MAAESKPLSVRAEQYFSLSPNNEVLFIQTEGEERSVKKCEIISTEDVEQTKSAVSQIFKDFPKATIRNFGFQHFTCRLVRPEEDEALIPLSEDFSLEGAFSRIQVNPEQEKQLEVTLVFCFTTAKCRELFYRTFACIFFRGWVGWQENHQFFVTKKLSKQEFSTQPEPILPLALERFNNSVRAQQEEAEEKK